MKRPYLQFYFGDWRNNAKIRSLTLHQKGAWLEIMGLLHDSDEYGIIRWTNKEIAVAAGCKARDVAELQRREILKGCLPGRVCNALVYTPKHGREKAESVVLIEQQPGPIWFSSRMVLDEHVRTRRGIGGYNHYTSTKPPFVNGTKPPFVHVPSLHPPETATATATASDRGRVRNTTALSDTDRWVGDFDGAASS